MFSKFRRVLVLLLTSCAVFLCIICMRESFWQRSTSHLYLTNQSAAGHPVPGEENGSKTGEESMSIFGCLFFLLNDTFVEQVSYIP